MTNETLLKRLQKIKEETSGNITELQSLINDIKVELMSSDLKTSDKQRLKTCLAYCEKMYKGARRILAFAHFEEEYQYFTDSSFLVRLVGEDIMNDLPRHDMVYQFKTGLYEPERNGAQYPNVSNIVRIEGESKKINTNELYKFCKANKGETIIIDFKDHKKAFDADELILALTFGNFINETSIDVHSVDGLKPITFVKQNETVMLICPLRLVEENKQYNTYTL